MTTARQRYSRRDPLRQRQESPAKSAPRTGTSAGVKGVGKRNVLPGQGAPDPSWRAASAGHASSPAWCRSPLPASGQAHCAAALLYLLLYQTLELRTQDFEFISLTWVELRGFEPRTSCMPSAGSTSTAVRLCRSPSQEVRARRVKSAPVAVLSCCTGQPARSGSQSAPDQPEPPRTLPRCPPRRPASDRAR